MATKATNNALHVALTEAPDAKQGASLMQQAQQIIIRDKASHEACREFLKGAKALKRHIVEHYAAIKKPLNEARNTVLDMERRDLAPVESAITIAERYDTEYVREQRRIEEAAAAEARRLAEAEERERRQKEADRAEAEALKLEASSNVLSEREQHFVSYYLASDKTPRDILQAAKTAGYKDYEAQAKRLMASEKINTAIANAIKAARLRAESAAKQAAPVVVETKPVETQIGSVAGTSVRRYYSCGEVDLRVLVQAWLDGKVPENAIQPNMVALNEAARALKELFPKSYPGCTLSHRDGVTG